METVTDYQRSGVIVDITAIPVHTDTSVEPGAAVLDIDPDEPRHITRVRAASHDFTLTAEQEAQVRDHYQAMNERAGHLLDWWSQFANRHMPRGWMP
jgi:hypothetical protein